jgi:hypothetical protein
MNAPHSSRKSLALLGATALLTMTAATAQVTTTGIDATGNYQHEVRSCLSGDTQQDRDTCLREARNARADKKRGQLDTDSAQFAANSIARCDALSGQDKAACRARMMGYGQTNGSVAGGGILREVETVVMPSNAESIRIERQTSDPLVLVLPPDQSNRLVALTKCNDGCVVSSSTEGISVQAK